VLLVEKSGVRFGKTENVFRKIIMCDNNCNQGRDCTCQDQTIQRTIDEVQKDARRFRYMLKGCDTLPAGTKFYPIRFEGPCDPRELCDAIDLAIQKDVEWMKCYDSGEKTESFVTKFKAWLQTKLA